MDAKKFGTVDEYFSCFPADLQEKLEEIRQIIKQAAPKAQEVISYNMPAFKMDSVLVYYAANKAHIGFYPTSVPIQVFKEDLVAYKTSKGAIQFPLDKAIPKALVKKIVKFRIEADKERTALKAKKRS